MDWLWYWIGQPYQILIGIVVIGVIVWYERGKTKRQKEANQKFAEKYAEGVSKKSASRRTKLMEKQVKPNAADGDEFEYGEPPGKNEKVEYRYDCHEDEYKLDIDEEDLY